MQRQLQQLLNVMLNVNTRVDATILRFSDKQIALGRFALAAN